MSNLITLVEGHDLTGATAGDTIDCDTTPGAAGFNAVAVLVLTGATGTPVCKIQTSPDGTTWTDAVVTSGLLRSTYMAQITLDQKVRFNCTAVGSAGDADAYIIV